MRSNFCFVTAHFAYCPFSAMAPSHVILRFMRFIASCFSAVFGDFRLSPYDPVMQIIPPGELFFDITAVALIALFSRVIILCFMAAVARGWAPLPLSQRLT